MVSDPYSQLRQAMVQIIAAHADATKDETGIPTFDARILAAMEEVPRHAFVPAEIRAYAHVDGPLPIGHDKTISQPFIAALMTTLLDPQSGDTVLEVGTGLGYHASVLSRLADKVYSIEIVEELSRQAAIRLGEVGCGNVQLRVGNGYHGWPENAPYDKIIVAAAPELIPPDLLQQLKPGGRMVIPAGLDAAQQLMVVEKNPDGKIKTRSVLPVRFAAMEGVAGF